MTMYANTQDGFFQRYIIHVLKSINSEGLSRSLFKSLLIFLKKLKTSLTYAHPYICTYM